MCAAVVVALNAVGKIEGVVVGIVQSEYSGARRLLTSRAVVRGGPLVTGGLDPLSLMDALDEVVRKTPAIYTAVDNLWETADSLRGIERLGYHYEPSLNYILDLSKTESELWRAVEATRRKQISRSERRGVILRELQTEGELPVHYALLAQTYRNAGLPLFHPSLFHEAFRRLVPQRMMKVLGAYHDELLVGTRMVPSYAGTVHDWFAGSSTNAKNLYPNDALVWGIVTKLLRAGWKTLRLRRSGSAGSTVRCSRVQAEIWWRGSFLRRLSEGAQAGRICDAAVDPQDP